MRTYRSTPATSTRENVPRSISAEDAFDNEGGATRASAGTTFAQAANAVRAAGVTVIRRFRRGRWTLTEVWR